jgi:hypothetical protein
MVNKTTVGFLRLIVLVFLAVPIHGQEKTVVPTPKPEKQSVYYHTWEDGEVKDCQTYSGHPHLLVCDVHDNSWSASFTDLIIQYAGMVRGKTKDARFQATVEKALAYVSTHSREFLVSFPKDAWPQSQTGIDLTLWECTKDKAITCKQFAL